MSISCPSRYRTADAIPAGDDKSAATCWAPALLLLEREMVVTDAPRASRAAATHCPMPPEAPDSTILDLDKCMLAHRFEWNAPKHIGEQDEHTLGHMDDRLFVLRIINAAHQIPEEVHVFEIDRPVRRQIPEAVGIQI